MFIIKKILNFIIEPIAYLVNMSFETGIFPDGLKTGKVVPVFKKSDPNSLENYRPVTVPIGFSKIFEYCFMDRLLKYLEKYQILTNNQHGFRSGMSTTTAIHSLYDNILNFLETGECPIGIFCDLSRAFDCVDHKRLLYKLNCYGIRGVALNWILTFLGNRKQLVSIKYNNPNGLSTATSDYSLLTIGVPQGSVLGPVLFLLYVNEIDSVSSNTHFTMYADDTSLIISNKTDEILELNCNNLFNNLSEWFFKNSLYFNADKTQVLRFHTSQKHCELLNFNINNTLLSTEAPTAKFLGIQLDNNLNWKAQCEAVTSKLASITYLFRNIRTVLCTEQLLCLYYAQVESRLRYGVCFWGNSTFASYVFIAQKRVLRCIAGVSYTHPCKDIFKNYKILTLPSLYIFELCIYVFKNQTKFILNSHYHNVNTRQKQNFHVPFARLKITAKSPNFIGPKFFNLLPDDIKYIKSESLFKSRLKEFLLSKCFYSVSDYFCVC